MKQINEEFKGTPQGGKRMKAGQAVQGRGQLHCTVRIVEL